MQTEIMPACVVVKSADPFQSKQGLQNFVGISAETAGSRGLCMHLVTIPPGGRARAHLHENHETAVYVLSGEVEMWFGEQLEEHLVCRAGEFAYIPANMPHVPANPHPTEPSVAVLARTDPREQESVVLRPDLEAALPTQR